MGTALVETPINDQLVDDVVGDLVERTPAVARRPLVPVLCQRVAAPHPLMECLVNWNVEVGRSSELSGSQRRISIWGGGHEDSGDYLRIGILGLDDPRHGWDIVC